MRGCKQLPSRRRLFTALTLLVTACLIGALVAAAGPESLDPQDAISTSLETVRQQLLTAARRGDPDFPDGKNVMLMHFSHVGSLKTKDGPVLVVDRRAVLTGMLAPRGLNYITFFDGELRYLGKLRYTNSRPLYCDEGKLYLFGDLDGLPPGGGGNVIDVNKGYDSLKVYSEYAYGSSGGIADAPGKETKTK